MNKIKYQDGVEVLADQLNFTESSKSTAIKDRKDFVQSGVARGLRVTKPGVTCTISMGVGYGANGERIEVPSDITGVVVTPGQYNFITLIYKEVEQKLKPHEKTGTSYTTEVTETYTVEVLSTSAYNSLTRLDRDNRVLVAIEKDGVIQQSYDLYETITSTAIDTHIHGADVLKFSLDTDDGECWFDFVYVVGGYSKIRYKSTGDNYGSFVTLNGNADYQLDSSSGTYCIIRVKIGFLPKESKEFFINVYRLYSPPIEGSGFYHTPIGSAKDGFHRDNIGGGLTVNENVHGETVDDLQGGSADVVVHQRRMHSSREKDEVSDIVIKKVRITHKAYSANGLGAKSKVAIKLGSSFSYGSERTLTQFYEEFIDNFEQKPGGGSWTRTDVNNMLACLALQSSNTWNYPGVCCRLKVEVIFSSGSSTELLLSGNSSITLRSTGINYAELNNDSEAANVHDWNLLATTMVLRESRTFPSGTTVSITLAHAGFVTVVSKVEALDYTKYTEGKDYIVNLTKGTITRIAGSSIPIGGTVYVTYNYYSLNTWYQDVYNVEDLEEYYGTNCIVSKQWFLNRNDNALKPYINGSSIVLMPLPIGDRYYIQGEGHSEVLSSSITPAGGFKYIAIDDSKILVQSSTLPDESYLILCKVFAGGGRLQNFEDLRVFASTSEFELQEKSVIKNKLDVGCVRKINLWDEADDSFIHILVNGSNADALHTHYDPIEDWMKKYYLKTILCKPQTPTPDPQCCRDYDGTEWCGCDDGIGAGVIGATIDPITNSVAPPSSYKPPGQLGVIEQNFRGIARVSKEDINSTQEAINYLASLMKGLRDRVFPEATEVMDTSGRMLNLTFIPLPNQHLDDKWFDGETVKEEECTWIVSPTFLWGLGGAHAPWLYLCTTLGSGVGGDGPKGEWEWTNWIDFLWKLANGNFLYGRWLVHFLFVSATDILTMLATILGTHANYHIIGSHQTRLDASARYVDPTIGSSNKYKGSFAPNSVPSDVGVAYQYINHTPDSVYDGSSSGLSSGLSSGTCSYTPMWIRTEQAYCGTEVTDSDTNWVSFTSPDIGIPGVTLLKFSAGTLAQELNGDDHTQGARFEYTYDPNFLGFFGVSRTLRYKAPGDFYAGGSTLNLPDGKIILFSSNPLYTCIVKIDISKLPNNSMTVNISTLSLGSKAGSSADEIQQDIKPKRDSAPPKPYNWGDKEWPPKGGLP